MNKVTPYMADIKSKATVLAENQRERIAELEAQLAKRPQTMDLREQALKGTSIKVDDTHAYSLWELLDFYMEQHDAQA